MTDRETAVSVGTAGRAAGAPPGQPPGTAHFRDGRQRILHTAAEPAVDFRIDNVQRLRPFLVSVVSDVDLWMYLSSTGALTAGRNNEDRALFPYETDDKIHQHAGVTGPMTIIRAHVAGNGKSATWKPFLGAAAHDVHRSMSKATLGNRVTFEERHDGLGLTFRYTWQACDAFGWVRTCELLAGDAHAFEIDVLDGVVNLLPGDANLGTQRAGSCLLNAFAQCELDIPSNLAIYSLASRITDKAEPSEALFANVAFATGMHGAKRLLSTDQLEAFLEGTDVADEHLLTGRRGAYLIASRFSLPAGGTQRWRIAIDAYRSQPQVAALQVKLTADDSLDDEIDRALAAADAKLTTLVAAADAQQLTADSIASAHHASNVLFNCMRGGALANNDELPTADFAQALAARNRAVADRAKPWLASLPETIHYSTLLGEAASQNDPQLLRLTMEYLPLTFGRRHGDPSRPWNRFNIRVTNDDGSPVLSYQGNWRDIFQNWEALATSYPMFVESMVAKFVNATTAEGFNPFRVTRDGFEYEVPDPHDPWSHIGYWGDHQIIYLLKLLEASQHAHAGALDALLGRQLFAYARVPYRLRPYAAMLEERRETIDFDWDQHREIEAALPAIGSDARLARNSSGEVLLVTLAEKLLVPALSKLSNLVPGLGIWMNTQRPEWNDANNALVGNGVSVVTLCYLRRYCAFCEKLFAAQGGAVFDVRGEVSAWLERTSAIFEQFAPSSANDPAQRRAMLDALGQSFEMHRGTLTGDADVSPVRADRLSKFFADALRHLDASIAHNRRRDGLFHAYNLLHVKETGIEGERLDVMLEGQVAALSSGLLSPSEAAEVVERMFTSGLWREDQKSFMLYPIRELPGFLQKNAVDEMAANRCALARRLLKSGDRSILQRDVTGQARFNSNFKNARDVEAALDALPTKVEPADRAEILDLYEKTFSHHGFTGRSGTMYGYEGIGCIYWHMVAKLLLAVQENFFRAVDKKAPEDVVDRLASLYARVRAGLGFNKSAESYGAFPLDAYSHTPLHAGAQQPGMTGQVKEEILTRFGELGVRVDDGIVRFAPRLLEERELLTEPADWNFIRPDGKPAAIALEPGTLGFTFAGTPIVYRTVDGAASIDIRRGDGSSEQVQGDALDVAASRSLLSRDGSIERIEVSIPIASFRRVAGIERAFTQMSQQESGARHP